jgi:hypothetical protein
LSIFAYIFAQSGWLIAHLSYSSKLLKTLLAGSSRRSHKQGTHVMSRV